MGRLGPERVESRRLDAIRARTNRVARRSRFVTSVRTPLNQRFAEAIEHPQLVLCWTLGHDRSLAVAFETKGVWHSLCHRCGHPLRRQSAGRWREITSDELARARSDAYSSWQAPKPSRAKAARIVRPAPPTARRKKVSSVKKKRDGAGSRSRAVTQS